LGIFAFGPSRGRVNGELSAQGTQFLKPCGGVTHNCGDADHLAGIAGEGHNSAHSVKRTTVARAFPRVGSKMLFLFDYGDEWRFQVEVTGLREAAPDAFYPRVIATAGKAPRQYSVSEDEV